RRSPSTSRASRAGSRVRSPSGPTRSGRCSCGSTSNGCSTTWKSENPRTRPPTSTLRSRISLRCCRRLSRVRASPLPRRHRLRILPQPDVPCARLVLRERVAPALLGRLLVLEALVVPREADGELHVLAPRAPRLYLVVAGKTWLTVGDRAS